MERKIRDKLSEALEFSRLLNLNPAFSFAIQQPLNNPVSRLIAIIIWLNLWPNLVQATDTGTSNNLFVLKKTGEDTFLASRSNLVTRDGISDLFFGYVDLTYGKRINEHWSIDAGYRHARLDLPDGWRDEYRPLVNLAYREQDEKWKIRNRNRLEFRYFDDESDDRIRYRNETVVIVRTTFSRFEFVPYFSQELFYEFTDDKFNQNWITIGAEKTLPGGKKIKLGYRWQAIKFLGEWSSRHLLVTGLSIFRF